LKRRGIFLVYMAVLSQAFAGVGGGTASIAITQDGFNLREVARGVFVHFGRPLPLDAPGHEDIANIGFIIGKTCVAVIDTGGSTKVGRALHAAILKETPLPICYVINTHAHVDHVLGNLAFKSDKPSFVGHRALGAALLRSRDFFIRDYGEDLDQPPTPDQIIVPDRSIDSEFVLDLGGRQVKLQAWPTAHTDCDLTIFDESTGTLWAGDLVFRERLPAVDGSVKGWLAVIEDLGRLHVSLTVPGHGSITRGIAPALRPERRYLQALLVGVRAELSQGRPVEDAIARVAADEESQWLLWPLVHPHNVLRAYEELAWE
jgi:quinoprotein relay system zinc metallohydrolase 2